MKKASLPLFLSILISSGGALNAQWLVGGNNLAANGSFGSNTNFAVIFETNNLERGRVTNAGLWGLGTTIPNSRLHINSLAGQDALRVQVGGTTRFFVGSNGGAAVGSLATPPANGLYVTGSVGIGTTTPERRLHVFNGSAGAVVANANAPLVVENSTNSYINVLAPNANERGILFGDPGNAQDGGIVYIGSTNALHFRTNGNATRMTLSSAGNLDITGGTLSFGSVETFADAGANTISVNSTFVPSSDNIRDLGTSALRWNEVWATDGTINTSDERDKTNIKNLEYGLKEIVKLRSTRFTWKNGAEKGEKLGLIAQELQKVLPEVVRDWEFKVNEETGAVEKVPAARMGVLYADIIPVLINGIQEQQQQIEGLSRKVERVEALETEVANLRQLVAELKNGYGNVVPNSSSGYLDGNTPNPFYNQTQIRYHLPSTMNNAQLVITDMKGAVVKTIALGKGSRQVTLNSNALAAGTYTYSLWVDNQLADSKKMVLTR